MTESDETAPNCTRPLILGYVCEWFLTTDAELTELKQQLAAFARAEGFALGTVYVERLDRSPAAYRELVAELERREAKAVVIPTMQHLTALGRATSRKQELEYQSSARVLVAGLQHPRQAQAFPIDRWGGRVNFAHRVRPAAPDGTLTRGPNDWSARNPGGSSRYQEHSRQRDR